MFINLSKLENIFTCRIREKTAKKFSSPKINRNVYFYGKYIGQNTIENKHKKSQFSFSFKRIKEKHINVTSFFFISILYNS